MNSTRPLHVFGIVRFYPDLREPLQDSWAREYSELAEAVLQRIDSGEAAVGYHVVVVPSPSMRSGRWKSMFNPATQCFAICEVVHESGGPFTADESRLMERTANDLGMAKLIERIRDNHPEAVTADTLPTDIEFDYYGIGHAID